MKKFTVFVLDVNRDPADPLTLYIEASTPESILGETAKVYRDSVSGDCLDVAESGANSIDATWHEMGAAIIGILPGHLPVVWNMDDCGQAEFESAFSQEPQK